jgi:hypothetical protein
MSPNAELRRALSRWRRRRAWVRHGAAWSAAVLALAWLGAAAFLIDWTLEPGRLERIVLFAALAGAALASWRRWSWPLLSRSESDLDVALLLDGRLDTGGDFAAALQFESGEAASWGSPALRQAVMARALERLRRGRDDGRLRARSLLPADALRVLKRRLLALAPSLGLLAAGAVAAADHARAFVERAALSDALYPGRARIRRIEIDGKRVADSPAGGRLVLQPCRAPRGRALEFEVIAGGPQPPSGRIRLRSLRSGLRAVVELEPAAGGTVPEAPEDAGGSSIWRGRVEHFHESLSYRIELGGETSPPGLVEAVEAAVVEVRALPRLPGGGADALGAGDAAEPGQRRFRLPEGSSVALELMAPHRPVVRPRVVIDGRSLPFSPRDGDGRSWSFEPVGTPLEAVRAALRFEVHAEDAGGFPLERPIVFEVDVVPDAPPRAAALARVSRVLPAARPRIAYGASDDHGLAALALEVEIERRAGGAERLERALDPLRSPPPGAEPSPPGPPKRVRGNLELDLSPWSLAAGDRVRVRLRAVDARAGAPGHAAFSPPIRFEIGDERGVLESIGAVEPGSWEELDAKIERQLSAVEEPSSDRDQASGEAR